jgi:hypothetical protein
MSQISANELEDFKNETANLKDKCQNAGDYIKEHCNSVRNLLQMQIEIQQEKLRIIHNHFLKEIEVYETKCVRNFDSNGQFKNKVDGFLNEIDQVVKKIENKEPNILRNELVVLKDRSKIITEELENEKFQDSPIEFKSTNFLLNFSNIGYIIYKKSEVILNSLQDMKSIDLTKLRSYDISYRFSCVRLSTDTFVVVFTDSAHDIRCIKFNTSERQLMSINRLGRCTGIRAYKICKFGCYLYFYTYVEKNKPRLVYDLPPEFPRFFLIQCDLFLDVRKKIELKKQLLCIVANSKNLYCLERELQKISVYDSGAEFDRIRRVIQFKWDDNTVAKPIIFHQMEVSESSLFLLAAGKVLILSESTGAVLKVLSLSLNNFKCLKNDFLLCNMRYERKLMIYDVKNEKVCEEKSFNEVIELVYADECFQSVALFVPGEPKIYY